jgi:hypothetical protein
MKHIKLFENYLFEAANAETLESPEIAKGVDVEGYLTKVKGEEASDRDKDSEYFTACKQFAASFAGKSMKVPNFGMVPKSTFKFEGFADCCFSIMTMSKGAGVWNNAIRKEESKLETGYYPTVFVAGYVTKDKGFADMDFNAEVNGPKKALAPALSGYYCYLNVHKRIGKDIDMKPAPEKFSMQELVALDPQWKTYFQSLVDLAAKFQ